MGLDFAPFVLKFLLQVTIPRSSSRLTRVRRKQEPTPRDLSHAGELIWLSCAGRENLAMTGEIAQQSKGLLLYQTTILVRRGEAER